MHAPKNYRLRSNWTITKSTLSALRSAASEGFLWTRILALLIEEQIVSKADGRSIYRTSIARITPRCSCCCISWPSQYGIILNSMYSNTLSTERVNFSTVSREHLAKHSFPIPNSAIASDITNNFFWCSRDTRCKRILSPSSHSPWSQVRHRSSPSSGSNLPPASSQTSAFPQP